MLVMPWALSVAAHANDDEKTMTMQEMLPTSTSKRACLYWRGAYALFYEARLQ